MRTEIIKITPELASEFLRKNTINRNIREKRVNQYVKEMQEGKWELNGESIKFNDKGELIDGQHRLSAIAKSGMTIEMCVVKDVPSTVTILDRGSGRSTADTLLIGGMDKKLANSVVVGIVRHHIFITTGNGNVSDNDIKDFISEHSENLLKATQICSNRGDSRQYKVSVRSAVIMLPIFYALESGIDYETCASFIDVLRSGFYNEKTQTAAVVCRNDIMAGVIRVHGSGGERKYSSYKIEKAISDYAKGIARKNSYAKWIDPVFSKTLVEEWENEKK